MKHALLISIYGRQLLSVDEVGNFTYAKGYDAETVMRELAVVGLELLSYIEEHEQLTEDTTVIGLRIVATKPEEGM